LPGSLAELHDADPPAAPQRAQRKAEGGGGLALAGAGVDHQQALGGDRLARDLGVLHRLALFHFRAVAPRGFVLLVHRDSLSRRLNRT